MARKAKEILAEIEQRLDADDILSLEEKEAIRRKAVEHVQAQKRKATEEALLHAYIKEEERKDKPAEQYVDIILNLPSHAPFIRLDNQVWFHGVMYEVPLSVYQTMVDMQARMQEQEDQTQGISKNDPRRLQRVINGRTGAITSGARA